MTRTLRAFARRTGLGMLVVAVMGSLLVACVPQAATVPVDPPKVRFVLYCLKGVKCDTTQKTVSDRASTVQNWYRSHVDPTNKNRTFRRLTTITVKSDLGLPDLYRNGAPDTTKALEMIESDLAATLVDRDDPDSPAVFEPHDERVKTMVFLGFRGLSNCGVTDLNNRRISIVDPVVHGKKCTGFASMNAAHELGHAFGLDHTVGDSLMNGGTGNGYSCGNHDTGPTSTKPRLLWQCSFTAADAAYLRNVRGNWFPETNPVASSAAVESDLVEKDISLPGWDAPDGAAVGFYRYWNQAIGDHYYAIQRDDAALAQLGWQYEGCEASVIDGSAPGTSEFRRLWNPTTTDHLYTASSAEYDWALMLGYVGEPYYAGDVYTEQVDGTIPLYRYWSSVNQDHFFTPVRDDAAYAGRGYYEYEGIVAYVLPASAGC